MYTVFQLTLSETTRQDRKVTWVIYSDNYQTQLQFALKEMNYKCINVYDVFSSLYGTDKGEI